MAYISAQRLTGTVGVEHDHAWRRHGSTVDGGPSVYTCELCDLTWTMYFDSPRVGPQRSGTHGL